MGALISKQHLDKVLGYLKIALQEGGKIECGGPIDGPVYFMRPTVITGLDPVTSRLQQEEIFGPVITISRFETDEEVLEMANSTTYGLSASIWTR